MSYFLFLGLLLQINLGWDSIADEVKVKLEYVMVFRSFVKK